MSISSRVQVVQRICISQACRIVPRIVGVHVQYVCFFCRLLHLFVRACVRDCPVFPHLLLVSYNFVGDAAAGCEVCALEGGV